VAIRPHAAPRLAGEHIPAGDEIRPKAREVKDDSRPADPIGCWGKETCIS
jgi:hypothetical protein